MEVRYRAHPVAGPLNLKAKSPLRRQRLLKAIFRGRSPGSLISSGKREAASVDRPKKIGFVPNRKS
jgi:hypothetical protein